MKVLNSFNLEGKVALVTGGAGIYGRQIVKALAEAGARTYMASRNIEALMRQVDVFASENVCVHAMELDQSNEDSVLSLRDRIVADAGRVDILVNNAVSRPMKGWDGDAQFFAESMAVNATGVFLMLRAFGDDMASRRSGSIINIGSIQGMVGPDLWLYDNLQSPEPPPDYFFHKGGMLQLSRYAAARLGKHGVRVNTISAGGFLWDQPQAFEDRYSSRTFLNRMAGETDLKGAIVFLASEASAYVTGANLVVDGGYTAK